MVRNTSTPPLYPVLYDAIHHHLKYSLGKTRENCSQGELFSAVGLAIRDRLVDQMLETEERYRKTDAKRLYYLSMDFPMGCSLDTNLANMGIVDLYRELLEEMGVELEDVLESESDAALGNGGLGRLAACFLDSLATLGMPGYGYGINYEYGLFKQQIESGYQKEQPDCWGPFGSPFLLKHPYDACLVPLYGRVEPGDIRDGAPTWRWVDWKIVYGVPYDLPITGYGGRTGSRRACIPPNPRTSLTCRCSTAGITSKPWNGRLPQK